MVGIKIGSNIESLNAQRSLENATSAARKNYERLSSGLRINKASDDPAGLSIASSISADTRVYTQGIRNISDGISVISIADSAVGALSDIVTRIQELAEQAANGTLGNTQRRSLDQEAQSLSKEFTRIARSTSFNSVNIFDGSLTDGIRIQAGYGVTGSIQSTLGGLIGTGTFAAATSYIADGGATYSVTTLDLNNDGILDLVAGGRGPTGEADVLFGIGDGTFGARTSYSMNGNNTYVLRVADINNDGISDLVTTGDNGASSQYAVRLGTGSGVFGGVTSGLLSGTTSRGLALSDVNGDNFLDLITTNTTGASGVVSVSLGNGNGSFGTATTYSGDLANSALTIADVNSDGNIDIITAGGTGPTAATVRFGNGNGTFSNSTSYTAETSSTNALALGDLNGDGYLDLVTGGQGAGVGRATVRLGSASGTFGSATSFVTLGNLVSSLALSDVNGDGNLDLISAGRDGVTGRTSIALGNGSGGFSAVTSYISESNFSSGVTLGDINQDGVLDLLSAGDGGVGYVTTRLQNTSNGISAINSFSLATRSDALNALSALSAKRTQLSTQRGVIGAFESRLNSASATLESTRLNYAAAYSRIADVDVAAEAADLVRNGIKQQAAAAVLSQANQAPALALKLLSL